MAYKLLIMSIYTYNWESVMDLDNKMLNIEEKKSINKNKNGQKPFFFIKKTLFIEMKNQKIKNTFFFSTLGERYISFVTRCIFLKNEF